MSNGTTQHAAPVIRASDGEREQTVALLQRNFAEGRLTQAELEERAGAAYAAQTTAQLRDLTTDLPALQEQPPPPGITLDPCLQCLLLCAFPPAGVAYWLLSRRKQPATTGNEPQTMMVSFGATGRRRRSIGGTGDAAD